MQEGMLWFDNDQKASLAAKVKRAAEYYRNKYGQTPNLCFLHPSMLTGGADQKTTLELRPSISMMPNHFWLGVGKESHAKNITR
jgi:hypothetical protein